MGMGRFPDRTTLKLNVDNQQDGEDGLRTRKSEKGMKEAGWREEKRHVKRPLAPQNCWHKENTFAKTSKRTRTLNGSYVTSRQNKRRWGGKGAQSNRRSV